MRPATIAEAFEDELHSLFERYDLGTFALVALRPEGGVGLVQKREHHLERLLPILREMIEHLESEGARDDD